MRNLNMVVIFVGEKLERDISWVKAETDEKLKALTGKLDAISRGIAGALRGRLGQYQVSRVVTASVYVSSGKPVIRLARYLHFFQDIAFSQLLQNTPQSFHFHPYLASRYPPFRDPVDSFHRVWMFFQIIQDRLPENRVVV